MEQEYIREFTGIDGLKHEIYVDKNGNRFTKGYYAREYIKCPFCGIWILIENYPENHKKECDGISGKEKRERISNRALSDLNKVLKEI